MSNFICAHLKEGVESCLINRSYPQVDHCPLEDRSCPRIDHFSRVDSCAQEAHCPRPALAPNLAPESAEAESAETHSQTYPHRTFLSCLCLSGHQLRHLHFPRFGPRFRSVNWLHLSFSTPAHPIRGSILGIFPRSLQCPRPRGLSTAERNPEHQRTYCFLYDRRLLPNLHRMRLFSWLGQGHSASTEVSS